MEVTSAPRIRLGLLILAGLAVIVVPFIWPKDESPEEKIRHLVVRMARAAEKRDLALVMEQVSPKFRSPEGWSRDDLKAYLAAQMFSGKWVRVFPTDIAVTMSGPAQATFAGKFILGRSRAEQLLDLAKKSEFEAYEIDARLELEDEKNWRVVYAEHRPISLSQLP